jgi:hypothetical protein
LWIEIDEQNTMSKLRQGGTEIDGGSRFTDPALLVRNCDDSHSKRGAPIPPARQTRCLCSSPDDVAGQLKRKLNFSDFRFRILEVGLVPPASSMRCAQVLNRPLRESFSSINRTCIYTEGFWG